MKLSKNIAFGVMALLSSYSVASAQSVVKTWVSSTGTDTGSCDISAPCASLQYAFIQTAIGGEIEVKDSGNYGPLYISHGVSIISSGPAATLSDYGTGNAGIYIAAGASDIVTIRGLTVNGHNLPGTYGIVVNSAKTVIIQNCIVSGATYGIYFYAPNTYIMLTNNLITGNNYGVDLGVNAYVAAGGNVIAGNIYVIYNGTIYSYGDNLVNTNTAADENAVTSHSVSKF